MVYLAFESRAGTEEEREALLNEVNGVFSYVLACYMIDHYRQWSPKYLD